MAAAFVQDLLGAARYGAGYGITATGSKTITVDNTIYVLVAAPSPATITSITDNLGNTYTEVFTFEDVAPNILTNSEQSLWQSQITVGGTLTSIVVNEPNAISFIAVGSCEFNGAASFAGYEGDGGAGDTSGVVTSAGGTGILFFTMAIFDNAGSGITGWTPPAGYTTAFTVGMGSQKVCSILAYKIGTTAAGTLTATWTTLAEWTAAHVRIFPVSSFLPQIYKRIP